MAAVKFTLDPAQIVFAEDARVIEGTRTGFTVMVIVLLAAVGTVVQTWLEVNKQEMISPLFSVLSM